MNGTGMPLIGCVFVFCTGTRCAHMPSGKKR